MCKFFSHPFLEPVQAENLEVQDYENSRHLENELKNRCRNLLNV